MKAIGLVIIVGFIGLYFVNAAFKVEIFHQEIIIHSAIQFFTGFFLIGVLFLYSHKIKLKSLVFLVLAFVLTDDILDYFRDVNSFTPEAILHSVYMLFWGSIAGYIVTKQIKKLIDSQ